MSHNSELEPLRKELARYRELYEQERTQFEEFQRYSKDLETELDMELTASKKKAADLTSTNTRLQSQLNDALSRAEGDRRDHHATENTLRAKLAVAEKREKELAHKLQHVEQLNDNLEKRERIQVQEIIDLTSAFEKALERCALLESGGPLNEEELNATSPSLSASTDVVMADSTTGTGVAAADGHSNGMEGSTPASSASRNGSSSSFFGSTLFSNMRRATTRVFSPHQERSSAAIVNSLFKKIEEVERQVDPAKYVIHRTPSRKN